MNFDQARREVIATCLALADQGYLAGTGGNVACRIDEQHFAITPSASDYYSMTPDDVCVLRLGDFYQVAGHRRPSVEHKLHAGVLRARRDCQASIHTHQPIASAYTLLRRDLEIHQPAHRSMLGAKAICVGYAPSGTSWLASKLRKRLRPEVNAYLLANHGVVCCGPSLGAAVARVEALEKESSIFFRRAILNQMGADRDQHLSKILMLLLENEEMEFAQ